MAFDATQWQITVKLNGLAPSAVNNGQTLVITQDNLVGLTDQEGNPVNFFDVVSPDGSDIRLSEDAAGSDEIPIETVDIDTGIDTVKIWTRKPIYELSDRLVHLHIGKPDATEYNVSDTFGRNAVWQDFEVVYHFSQSNKLLDSTGKHDLAEFGTLDSVIAKVGYGIGSSNSYSNRGESSGYKGVSGSTARTVSFWSEAVAGQDRGIATWGTDATGQRWSVWLQAGNLRTEITGSFKKSNNSTSDGTYKRYSSIYSGGSFPENTKHRVNGVNESGYSQGSSITPNTGSSQDVIVNAYSNLAGTTAGGNQLDEFSIRAFAISDDLDSTEYDYQSDPSTFWDVVSVTNRAAGGGGEKQVVVDSISHSLSVTEGGLSQGYSVTPSDIFQSFRIDQPLMHAHGSLSPSEVSHGQGLSASVLTQLSNIIPVGMVQIHSIDDSNLAPAHIVVVNGLSQSHGVDSAALAAEGSINAQSLSQAQSVAELLISQVHQVAPQNITQMQGSSLAGLGQGFTLIVNAATQSQGIDTAPLSSESSLIVSDLGQTQIIDNAGIVEHAVLVTNSLTQEQAIGTVVFEREKRIGSVRVRFGMADMRVKFALSDIRVKFGE